MQRGLVVETMNQASKRRKLCVEETGVLCPQPSWTSSSPSSSFPSSRHLGNGRCRTSKQTCTLKNWGPKDHRKKDLILLFKSPRARVFQKPCFVGNLCLYKLWPELLIYSLVARFNKEIIQKTPFLSIFTLVDVVSAALQKTLLTPESSRSCDLLGHDRKSAL